MQGDFPRADVESNVVSRLSVDDYAELKRMVCPFCRQGLPSRFTVEFDPKVNRHVAMFKHYIEGTCEQFTCEGITVRAARGCVQRALEDPRHLLEEEI
jgi:hypothetical protein